MIETIEHNEALEDLIQVGDSFMEDLQQAINFRVEELLKENGIEYEDIEDLLSGVSVSIIIKYKKDE